MKLSLLLGICLLFEVMTQQTGPLGGEASFEFCDYMRENRKWGPATGSGNVPVDQDGWPQTDCSACPFDLRPAHAWAPPIEDPEKRQLDLSGTWKLILTGQATIEVTSGQKLSNVKYDQGTNTQTADITFPVGKYPDVQDLLTLKFTNTKRTPTSAANTGFSKLRIIHPSCYNTPDKLFTDNCIKMMQPFDHLRVMGALGTNYNPWRCGGADAVPCSILEWKDRALPTHAYFGDTSLCKGCVGYPWEFVLLLANEANKDIWINIPVSASDAEFKGTETPNDPSQTYVGELVKLFKSGNQYTNNVGLKSNLNVYIEHSNEVWNFGFMQNGFNKAAAADDVKHGNTPINNNKPAWVNGSNPDTWAYRRHYLRLKQTSKEFETALGATRVRPIYAWWGIMWGPAIPAMNDTLYWAQETFGSVKQDIWGLSVAHYFGPAGANATVEDTIKAFCDSSDANKPITNVMVNLKKQFGVKLTAYEAGPGHDVGNKDNIANYIMANRNAGMTKCVEKDVRDNFWALGGDLYNYFAIEGYCSIYGCWGATEDWKDFNTPKLQAIYALTGHHPDTPLPANRTIAYDYTVRHA